MIHSGLARLSWPGTRDDKTVRKCADFNLEADKLTDIDDGIVNTGEVVHSSVG